MTRRILSIDIETYSDVDITNGVYRYVDTPAFEILLFGYAFDDDDPVTVDLANGEKLPSVVLSALTDPSVEKHAYNAQFERVCISKFLGLGGYLPPEQWWCTAVHARMAGLPNTLKQVGKVLHLAEQKDSAGVNLINYFSKPCKPTKANGGRTRNFPTDNPSRWGEYKSYNVQDVRSERAISKYLSDMYFDVEREKRNYWVDQRINDRGIRVDRELVENIYEYSTRYRLALVEKSKRLTGLENPDSMSQLKAWLALQGMQVDRITKDTLPSLIENSTSDTVREVLETRVVLAKTSITKYEKMLDTVCSDGRIHGTIQFYGANRTGRYAGRLIQIQNFPQNHLDGLSEIRTIIRRKDFRTLEALYGDPQEVFKQILRTMLIPSEGCTYCVADYSAIEARVISWMAHETWAEEVFHGSGKIYEHTAAMMFGVDVDKIKKGNPEYELRQRGKVATLACGYGGGPKAMEAMDTMHKIDPSEYPDCVHKWRKANPHIVAMWSSIERTCRMALEWSVPVPWSSANTKITFLRKGGNMYVGLPSGRWLTYFKMRVDEENNLRYWGTDAKGWCELHTWGGKLVENIVQAIARDELAEALSRVESSEDFDVVFHIHDEIIAETPIFQAEPGLTEMKNLMSIGTKWDAGLFLPAAGYTTNYYRKD